MKHIRVILCTEDFTLHAPIAAGLRDDPWLTLVAHVPLASPEALVATITQADFLLCTQAAYTIHHDQIEAHSVPTIMLRASDADTLAKGPFVVDCVRLPDKGTPQHMLIMLRELSAKIKLASTYAPRTSSSTVQASNPSSMVIAIGASTGGTEALLAVLEALPPSTPGIVVVQHMPAAFTPVFAKRLNTRCALAVKEAETGDAIRTGHVYIAPGGLHMRLQRAGQVYRLRCTPGSPIKGHCPSVDILMASVAHHVGACSLGILLTGMGTDGAEGMQAIRNAGGQTLAQNEATSVVYGMPKAANDLDAVDHLLPLQMIAPFIQEYGARAQL